MKQKTLNPARTKKWTHVHTNRRGIHFILCLSFCIMRICLFYSFFIVFLPFCLSIFMCLCNSGIKVFVSLCLCIYVCICVCHCVCYCGFVSHCVCMYIVCVCTCHCVCVIVRVCLYSWVYKCVIVFEFLFTGSWK